MMKLPHFFGEICAQRYANQQICHAVAAATRVKQGVGLCVLQQPLAKLEKSETVTVMSAT
jgi:hypothetical protein